MADLNDPKTYWWRNAVIYQVYVRSFADSDGDGIGDLPGITSRLPHLADLGVDALWITPFYTSPQHDHGYDVADYRDVDPLFGSLADADDLIARAHELGLRVVVDLVPNHTSDQHEWFQAALAAGPGSPERAPLPLPRQPRGRRTAPRPTTGSRSSAARRGPRSDDGQWYLHLFDSTPARPRLAQPRGAGDVRGRPALLARPRRRRLPRRRGARPVQGGQPARPGRSPRAAGPAPARSTPTTRWSRATSRTSRCGTSRRSTTSTARWHRVLDEAGRATGWPSPRPGPRRPSRWPPSSDPTSSTRPSTSPGCSPTGRPRPSRRSSPSTLAAVAPVGASPTWVLSNHDVVRHVTRYGGGEQGLARGRAATLAMLALPGSSYLYQGEELGLEQVDVAPEDRQDPSYLRTGEVGRDGCRVPIPWGGDAAPYDFGPGAGQPWIPQPADWAVAHRRRPDRGRRARRWRSTARALAARRELRAGPPATEVELLDLGTRRARRSGAAPSRSCSTAARPPSSCPRARCCIASGPVDDGALPADTAVWLR